MDDPNRLLETEDGQDAIHVAENPAEETVVQDSPAKHVVSSHPPAQIGRYRIDKMLGEGGFGRVYLGYDEELKRQVALKVPRRERVSQPSDMEAYLVEAQTLASLDHSAIVPVHDVGRTDDGLCYVVSKFIEGADLQARLERDRLSHHESADLVATVAEALHYAHTKGLVHRDVKPANILIDLGGKPYVADFGLALKEEDIGSGSGWAGTPDYMSPEQARGEGHRVDGRSDIFSLGVVFYEMLVGKRPFQGDTSRKLLEQISSVEARPLRQRDDRIPKELERICLKALSRKAADRYTVAKDMADDLRHFLNESPQKFSAAPVTSGGSQVAAGADTRIASDSSAATSASDSQPIRVVPKGLRSFDEHDADFFLELLPGPHDREGLPDSIRFWKTRIEEADADKTFSVGLIYGPSGCGKSSLVKAGLLPRLSEDVIAVYVESTADETETRLLQGLRKRCPALPDDLSLKETLEALRRGRGLPHGEKVLIVLDQFEQWLHAHREPVDTMLVAALRQCDGGTLQAIVMVRDDFWMAATRFMRELEVRLLEGHNSNVVDLFPVRHARKVLTAFGRAFGELPQSPRDQSQDQTHFVEQAVTGLGEEGKVICIRLALFAEMMKSKSWSPASLKEVGGTSGVGVTFLEETFSASTAPPEHRYHQKAARNVLRALLPDSGTDIKGHMRSSDELLQASGYDRRPADFQDLLKILDSEIRLVTPTDPEGDWSGDNAETPNSDPGQKYFQLTHDYLVPSLRDWLTRKQRETRKGRAELRLAERSTLWNAKPENRHLPSWWEYLSVVGLTTRISWTESERRMMRNAGRFHGVRAALGLAIIALLIIAGVSLEQRIADQRERTRTEARMDALIDSIFLAPPAEAGERITRLMFATSKSHREDAINRLQLTLDEPVPPIASPEERDNLASGKANIAVSLVRMDEHEQVWPLLKHRDDPAQRTYLIHRFSPAGAEAGSIVSQLEKEQEPSTRQALILSLGEFDETQFPSDDRKKLIPRLVGFYNGDNDPGVHAAAEWLLRRWKQDDQLKQDADKLKETDQQFQARKPEDKRRWYINSTGLTMVIIDPESEPARSEDETLRATNIDHHFAIAAYEVTVAQFLRFKKDHQYNREYSPDPACVMNSVNWDEAVAYCNWLSEQEGIDKSQWCYRPNAKEKFVEGMTIAPDFLTLRGYRLPTEAEWEYACRAGSETDFFFGDSEAMLENYACYLNNADSRSFPVGRLKPNDLGLFDMHGNAQEWCQDVYRPGLTTDYETEDLQVTFKKDRVLRGGSFYDGAPNCRSAIRRGSQSDNRDDHLNVGFRVSRIHP